MEEFVQESKFWKFLGFMWNPLSWVMEAAAIMAIIMTNGGVSVTFLDSYVKASLLGLCVYYLSFKGFKCRDIILHNAGGSILMFFLFFVWQDRPPDWQDFIGILVLLVINSTISFWEENNAGNAAAALMARLAPKTKVN